MLEVVGVIITCFKNSHARMILTPCTVFGVPLGKSAVTCALEMAQDVCRGGKHRWAPHSLGIFLLYFKNIFILCLLLPAAPHPLHQPCKAESTDWNARLVCATASKRHSSKCHSKQASGLHHARCAAQVWQAPQQASATAATWHGATASKQAACMCSTRSASATASKRHSSKCITR